MQHCYFVYCLYLKSPRHVSMPHTFFDQQGGLCIILEIVEHIFLQRIGSLTFTSGNPVQWSLCEYNYYNNDWGIDYMRF